MGLFLFWLSLGRDHAYDLEHSEEPVGSLHKAYETKAGEEADGAACGLKVKTTSEVPSLR